MIIILAPRDAGINGYGQRVLSYLVRGKATFEVVLFEKGFHCMWECLALPFPEQDFFTIGEKNVMDVQFLGIGFGLLRRVAWTD